MPNVRVRTHDSLDFHISVCFIDFVKITYDEFAVLREDE